LIGVIARPDQVEVVEEFFELFKTAWEYHRPGRVYDVVVATADEIPQVRARLVVAYGPRTKNLDAWVGIAGRERHRGAWLSEGETGLPIYGELSTFAAGANRSCCVTRNREIAGVVAGSPDSIVIRLGYDLFDEVRFLLSSGQPVEHAHLPTLDIHIRMLRDWILNAGMPLLEIPAIPAGHLFSVCLTHDIDFVGIRNHKFDHSMWGFLYRATFEAVRRTFRGRISTGQLRKSLRAVVSLPFVYLGWAKDFWEPFAWYLEVEKGLPSTYFLIPFKRRAGEKVAGPHPSRRATAYDVGDLVDSTAALQRAGCELAVHGIDSWHSVEKGCEELGRVADATGQNRPGIRMHWLLRDERTPLVLEAAGYAYDSTVGYNETIGYRAGTGQVFRPLGTRRLLELPLHIQDGALFYPQRLDLSEPEAEKRSRVLIDHACDSGGALTILWHDRSHGPERFWGDFYVRLVHALKSEGAWFGTAGEVVSWFRKRRQVAFTTAEGVGGTAPRLQYPGEEIFPALTVRIYPPTTSALGAGRKATSEFVDIPWNGKSVEEMEQKIASHFSHRPPQVVINSVS